MLKRRKGAHVHLQKVSPTSLDFCQYDDNKLTASYSNAKIRVYDIETGQVAVTLKNSDETYGNIASMITV